jgi:hypothetical protein
VSMRGHYLLSTAWGKAGTDGSRGLPFIHRCTRAAPDRVGEEIAAVRGHFGGRL